MRVTQSAMATGAALSVSNPLDTDLIDGWLMNEGSGNTFFDANTTNANNVTAASPANFTWQANAGFPGITPYFDGSPATAAASIASLTDFTGTEPFSVGLWVTVPSEPSHAFALVGNIHPASSYQGWSIELGYDGPYYQLYFYLINNYPSNAIQVQLGSANIEAGTRYYIVVTYDGSQSAAGVKIYVDGSVRTDATVIYDSLSASAASGLPVYIGQRSDGTEPLIGTVAFVRIYSGVISSPDVPSLYALGPQ